MDLNIFGYAPSDSVVAAFGLAAVTGCMIAFKSAAKPKRDWTLVYLLLIYGLPFVVAIAVAEQSGNSKSVAIMLTAWVLTGTLLFTVLWTAIWWVVFKVLDNAHPWYSTKRRLDLQVGNHSSGSASAEASTTTQVAPSGPERDLGAAEPEAVSTTAKAA